MINSAKQSNAGTKLRAVIMQKLAFAAVSRNYFNMPVWIARHQGMFADEGLHVAIELYDGTETS
jgi:hypothetical protein